ncbi:adenylate/guanylate cyclase domain-containing protein [Camelimonas abortus]|uniref:Adenylate/guanylate cyclase domain-containing protein n=1 Tax=Camelimonas abortus TaxID=1017184 RepID=A0ABV7LC72_9HYPH
MARLAHSEGRELLRQADLDAERQVSYVRIATATLLYLLIRLLADPEDFTAQSSAAMLRTAEATLALLFLSGVAALALVWSGMWRAWMTYLTVTLDTVVVLANLAITAAFTPLSGDFISAYPAAAAIPLVLMTSTVRMRPEVQAYCALLILAGVLLIALGNGHLTYEERKKIVGPLAAMFGENANATRLLILAGMGGVTWVAAVRGRNQLLRAVDETRRRLNLGRYLPSELSHILATSSMDELKKGSRRNVGLMFVDIRNSTAMEESLDAPTLSVMINDFRERLTRIAQKHDVIIDKFIGDGALLVSGILETRPDDARRIVECGKEILLAIHEWSRRREAQGAPPVRVGVGVHYGEAFVGAVGNDDRLEFTVLGDAVNVAARLEQMTKTAGTPMLVSGDALAAAGLAGEESAAEYRFVGTQLLRGRTEPVPVYAPAVADRIVGPAPVTQ